MSEMWMPVIFTAIIVFGVVGGQLAHTVLKRLLPLLETLVQEKQKGLSRADTSDLKAEISALKNQVARLEASEQRLEGVEEQVSFLQSLIEERSDERKLSP